MTVMIFFFCLAILSSEVLEQNNNRKQTYKVIFKVKKESRNVVEEVASHIIESEKEIDTFIDDALKKHLDLAIEQLVKANEPFEDANKLNVGKAKSGNRNIDACKGQVGENVGKSSSLRTGVQKNYIPQTTNIHNLVNCLIKDAVFFLRRFNRFCFKRKSGEIDVKTTEEFLLENKDLLPDSIIAKAYDLVENINKKKANVKFVINCNEQTKWNDFIDKSTYTSFVKDFMPCVIKEFFSFVYKDGYQFEKVFINTEEDSRGTRSLDREVTNVIATTMQNYDTVNNLETKNKKVLIKHIKVYDSFVISYEVNAEIIGLIQVTETIKKHHTENFQDCTPIKIIYKSDTANDDVKNFNKYFKEKDVTARDQKLAQILQKQKDRWFKDLESILCNATRLSDLGEWMKTPDNAKSNFEKSFEYEQRPGNRFPINCNHRLPPITLTDVIKDFAADMSNFFLLFCDRSFSIFDLTDILLTLSKSNIEMHCNFSYTKNYLEQITNAKEKDIFTKSFIKYLVQLQKISKIKKYERESRKLAYVRNCIELIGEAYKRFDGFIYIASHLNDKPNIEEALKEGNIGSSTRTHQIMLTNVGSEGKSKLQKAKDRKYKKESQKDRNENSYIAKEPKYNVQEIAKIFKYTGDNNNTKRATKHASPATHKNVGGKKNTKSDTVLSAGEKHDAHAHKINKNKATLRSGKNKKTSKKQEAGHIPLQNNNESKIQRVEIVVSKKVSTNFVSDGGADSVDNRKSNNVISPTAQEPCQENKALVTNEDTASYVSSIGNDVLKVLDTDVMMIGASTVTTLTTGKTDDKSNEQSEDHAKEAVKITNSNLVSESQDEEYSHLNDSKQQLTGSEEVNKPHVSIGRTQVLPQKAITTQINNNDVKQEAAQEGVGNTSNEVNTSSGGISPQISQDVYAIIGDSKFCFFANAGDDEEQKPAETSQEFDEARQQGGSKDMSLLTVSNPNKQDKGQMRAINLSASDVNPKKQTTETENTTATPSQLPTSNIPPTFLAIQNTDRHQQQPNLMPVIQEGFLVNPDGTAQHGVMHGSAPAPDVICINGTLYAIVPYQQSQ